MYKGVHNSAAVYVGYSLTLVGVTLWLWSMYVYIPQCYPTRMRALGTGWTDGVGHLGAWGGVLIAGALFSVTAPRAFFLFVTIPCALAARRPDRDLREEPAQPRARGTGPD